MKLISKSVNELIIINQVIKVRIIKFIFIILGLFGSIFNLK